MSKEVIFLHPDLGLGGAERLVVDAALALRNSGHNVSFVTSYHNKQHCFKETKDGTLKVKVVGEWIPRNICGRFFALFAYLKMVYCAFYILFFRSPDLVFCDLVSACIPILKLGKSKIIFYCHFPDKLLSRPEGVLKQIYRAPLDWMEEKTTGLADKLYVNSEFTKGVFKKSFSSLKVEPNVLYPSINTAGFDNVERVPVDPRILRTDVVYLSLNRYERKKAVELSINALNNLKKIITSLSLPFGHIKLVIAGGYDLRVKENVEYYKELRDLVSSFDLDDNVIFFKSPSDAAKVSLLRRCDCLIYTPANEHFGIVPLEAMYCYKPVIACNSGGPTETVKHGLTGFLCQQNEREFANAMLRLTNNNELKLKMGNEGHARFMKHFSFNAFSKKLNKDVEELIGKPKEN